METVYNAANAASKALFGENTNPNSQNPNQTQNRNPNAVTTDTSDYDRPSASETNPFRQSGTDTDSNNPFRSATGPTTKPFDSTNTSGFGSQHTATSGSGGHEVLNKPYDSGVGSLEKSSARTYDQPSGNDFDQPSTAGVFAEHSSNYGNNPASSFDKPTTTTSTFRKTSIGDLNKDGARHEISDLDKQRVGVHSSNPTISSINDHSNAFSSDHNKPVTSRFSEDTNTPHTSTSTGTGAGVLGGLGVSHEHHTPTNRDFSQSSTTDHSSYMPGAFSDNTSGNNNPDSSLSRDSTTTHTPHHQSGAPAQGSNIQSLVDPNPATSTSGISSTSKPTSTSNPSTTAGSATHGATNSGLEAANAAPKSVTGAVGSGPGAAVEPSVGAHPGHAQQQTPKQQGADRPLEEPSNTSTSTSKRDTGAPKPLGLGAQNNEHSQGTGEKYEKSTGVAAEGGDFDASRPGAGKEADRLLDEKGIHHGKETKPDTSDVTAGLGHSKLLPGHKDKSHTDTPKDHHHDNQTTPPPSDGGSSGHKGLAEKIKEKLHIHH
ncbi:uncharacterized protein LAJ45_07530 [Morchella importuna]|uniref:uncharacterized protein n=1 Tax=Morchella importuna TaxID=1174673 RepID=UPI001E8E6399|nr:uncharacterized protein LAJ45_07530 [Morchella importuna]KAH8148428.1 hypothetical protein LAJ45_07530 [Morchella importuna]